MHAPFNLLLICNNCICERQLPISLNIPLHKRGCCLSCLVLSDLQAVFVFNNLYVSIKVRKMNLGKWLPIGANAASVILKMSIIDNDGCHNNGLQFHW